MRNAEQMAGPVDAVRLTVRYGGDRYEVVKRTVVRKSVPPSAPLLDDEEETGFSVEVRRGGRSVYRRLLVDAVGRDVEVFTGDPDRPMARIPVDDPVGTFTVVVPMMDADEIAIVGPPRARARDRARKASKETAATAQRVGDLATFPMPSRARWRRAMSAADGSVIGLTKIIDRGPATTKWNLVLVSEGYTAGQLPQFHTDCQDFVDFLLATEPFDEDEVQCGINVYRLDVASDESSADNPATCTDGNIPTGTAVASYFDATFCGNGKIRRLLVVDDALAIDTVDDHLPEWDQIIVIVNSTLYGGAGGTVATTSLAGDWENIAVHELGHAAAFGLADEYEYYVGCGLETDRDNHPAVEPSEPNVTVNNDPATIKWSARVTDNPMKTSNNPDCTMCDPTPNPFAATTVGAFEGAHDYHCDAYRPGWDCMMRNFGRVLRGLPAGHPGHDRIVQSARPSSTWLRRPCPSTTCPRVSKPPGRWCSTSSSCLTETFTIIAGPTVTSGPPGTAFGTPLGLQVAGGLAARPGHPPGTTLDHLHRDDRRRHGIGRGHHPFRPDAATVDGAHRGQHRPPAHRRGRARPRQVGEHGRGRRDGRTRASRCCAIRRSPL